MSLAERLSSKFHICSFLHIFFLFIFRTISQPRALSADIPAVGRGLFTKYPASLRRITVLENFQAILFIFSDETSSNRDIFFTKDAVKTFFLTSKISAQEICQNSVFPYLVKLNDNGSYHGLREPIRKLENHYPELKIDLYSILVIELSGEQFL